MPIPDRTQLEELLPIESQCVSILVPTHRAGKEVQQAKIRLKNLLGEAAGRLTGHQLRKDRIEETLRPGHDLLEDEGLWRSLEDGLAVYLAPGFSRVFKVPLPLEETLVVGSRFYVLPLLPPLGNRGDFFLLALSLKSVRLFAADRFEVREIDLPGVPKSLTDAVGSDYEEDNVQVHTVRPGTGGAIVHGHGVGQAEDEKEEATRFCLRVDAGLRRILLGGGNGTRPMVIAAAEPLASIYAQVSHYPTSCPIASPATPSRCRRRSSARGRGRSSKERWRASSRAPSSAAASCSASGARRATRARSCSPPSTVASTPCSWRGGRSDGERSTSRRDGWSCSTSPVPRATSC